MNDGPLDRYLILRAKSRFKIRLSEAGCVAQEGRGAPRKFSDCSALLSQGGHKNEGRTLVFRASGQGTCPRGSSGQDEICLVHGLVLRQGHASPVDLHQENRGVMWGGTSRG